MTSDLDDFHDLVAKTKAMPVGFFGSGLSQRYSGAPTWQRLLEVFAERNGRSFNYYSGLTRVEEIHRLPAVASLIAEDLYRDWFSSDRYEESRLIFSKDVSENADPLKFEIAKYLSSLSLILSPEIALERGKLSSVQLHAIITTNWDATLDQCFPDLNPYVGQDRLIFSNSFAIGEIYKIHGCATMPRSLVLTTEDYVRYQVRNYYLVAKLLTMFIKHPIVFMGYSLQDENIQTMFRQLIDCLSQDQIFQLSHRLFFVSRTGSQRRPGLNQVSFNFGHHQMVVWNYVTDDFGEIYEVLGNLPRHYPVQFLRKLRKDIFELAMSSTPDTMVRVIDFDSNTDLDKIEVVIGVGMMAKLAARGYIGYVRDDLVRDMLRADLNHEIDLLIGDSLPKILRGPKFVPIFYPLFLAGRLSEEGVLVETEGLPDSVQKALADVSALTPQHTKDQARRRQQYFRELLQENEEVALGYGLIAQFDIEDIKALRDFLVSKQDPVFPKGKFETTLWKLSCKYDRMVFGSEWNGDRRALHEALGISSKSTISTLEE